MFDSNDATLHLMAAIQAWLNQAVGRSTEAAKTAMAQCLSEPGCDITLTVRLRAGVAALAIETPKGAVELVRATVPHQGEPDRADAPAGPSGLN